MQCHEENPAARLTLLLVSAYTAQPRHEFPFRRDFNVETFADCFADYVLRPGDLELCGDPLENSSTYADNAGGAAPKKEAIIMKDPRYTSLARLLVHHSMQVKAPDRVLIEAFDVPPDFTAELIRRGELREDEATQHPHYGVLTRALGVGPEVEIEHRTLPVEEGDRIVVCSDGLFNELSGGEIAHAVAGGADVAAIVDFLIDGAIAHGGRDNVSVVVAEVAA